jgi:hypothetical protein
MLLRRRLLSELRYGQDAAVGIVDIADTVDREDRLAAVDTVGKRPLAGMFSVS